MTFRSIILSTLFCGALLIPGFTRAYDVLSTQAYQVTSNTYLFLIEYEYGYLNADAYMPIEAERTAVADNIPHLTYELQDQSGDALTTGLHASIVLSDALVSDEYYTIEPGDRQSFTLLALYQGEVRPGSAVVTSLGNVVDTGDETSYLEASAEQLAAYRAVLPALGGGK